LVRNVAATLGGPDILLFNAAGPSPGPFLSHEPDDWQRALELILLSAVTLCRGAVPRRLRSLAAKRAAGTGGSIEDAMAENAASVLASYVTGTALSVDGRLHRSIF
jgi:NAD(P)-dependent dehydrogenase (short-subunit alcohol dehydrogenase family)